MKATKLVWHYCRDVHCIQQWIKIQIDKICDKNESQQLINSMQFSFSFMNVSKQCDTLFFY